jgi:hypothetical protein
MFTRGYAMLQKLEHTVEFQWDETDHVTVTERKPVRHHMKVYRNQYSKSIARNAWKNLILGGFVVVKIDQSQAY